MRKVRGALLEVTIILCIGGLIGATLAVVSNYFIIGAEYLGKQRETGTLLNLKYGDQSISLSSLLFLWAAAAVVLLIKKGLKVTSWTGPADAIYAAHQPNHPLDIKQGFASTLAAFASAGGGASVGQYGPIVHFGATMGVWLKRFISSRLSYEIYLGCGVAAAISAGFNAPIAGVIFAHEAILRRFSVSAIAPITVASISASTLSNLWFPNATAFEIGTAVPGLSEVVPFLMVLAPVFSMVAIAFMMTLRSSSNWAARTKISPTVLLFAGATVCGVVGIWVPQILGLGISSMNQMLAGDYGLTLLTTVLVAKILVTAICLSSGLFGGVFSPALFIGVASGALAGQLLTALGFTDVATVVTLAAMAAVSSAVIGAPLTAVMIVLELTHSYEYAVTAMIAVTLCSLVTNRLFGLSFYDRQLLDRGIDIGRGRDALALSQERVGDIASADIAQASPDTSGDQVYQSLLACGHTEAYVVAEGQLRGKLSIYDAIKASADPVSSTMDVAPARLYTDQSLDYAMHKVSQFSGESLPVVDRATGRLCGRLTEGALFQAIIAVQRKARRPE